MISLLNTFGDRVGMSIILNCLTKKTASKQLRSINRSEITVTEEAYDFLHVLQVNVWIALWNELGAYVYLSDLYYNQLLSSSDAAC